MAKEESALQHGRRYVVEQIVEVWDNLGKNNLWKRILKNVVATTLLVSICLIPGSKNAIGKAAYLGAIVTVFGHPGRRFGQLAEALILAVSGTFLGVAWSLFGVYLGSLVIDQYPPAAYAIRGSFLAIATLFHGFLRSRTPRLFIFVLLMIIVCVVSLVSTAKTVTIVEATQILYPILIAAGCIVVINLCIFPEFSSRFLGQTTIDTLCDTAKALEDAGRYFIEAEGTATAKEILQESSEEEKDSSSAERHPKDLAKVKSRAEKVSIYEKLKSIVSKTTRSTSNADEALEGTQKISLKDLTASKAQIRKKLANCKDAQRECNFELAVSVLPPRDMKPVSVVAMKKMVANTIAVISACESKFALLGDDEAEEGGLSEEEKPSTQKAKGAGNVDSEKTQGADARDPPSTEVTDEDLVLNQDKAELEMIKPRREIEFGDARLLRYLLMRVAKPYKDLHTVFARTVDVVTACLAYAYVRSHSPTLVQCIFAKDPQDVPNLPSGARAPKGVMIEEVDLHISSLQQALTQFDVDTISAFEGAVTMEELEGKELDVMPREEVFLLSSFMLNVRQAATHLQDMLTYSRELIEQRQQRHDRRRVYAPRIKWSKWLNTGGEEDEAVPAPARKATKQGNTKPEEDDGDAESLDSRIKTISSRKRTDLEKSINTNGREESSAKEQARRLPEHKSTASREGNGSLGLRLRGNAADMIEWMQDSDDVLYALKLGFAVMLVTWPSLVASWNTWYSLNRGLWAALQLVLITEVSIGTSVNIFILRGVGTTLGCVWGWAALEARGENRIVCAVMVAIALFPCAYVQLGTQYPKAGMVAIVSICVVTLATELDTVPGTATDNFLKRWIAFMIGGAVALIVEVVLLPVKARTRLIDSIASALHNVNEMERCIAAGIESGRKIDIFAEENFLRFEDASGKANNALEAAETFLPFCSKEPRIKGSFEGLALIYSEILYVLHQIVDRMDNMLQLRTAYGSGPLEELNADIYPYRRNVAGSITLTLFAIHGALTTKIPLPQFLPSARLAHLRMINRVREVVLEKVSQDQGSHELVTKLARQRALRRKYMSWNASSAAQAEIIEFLEELIDLTKLLVGANEFRSGLLTRPTYRDYACKKDEIIKTGDEDEAVAIAEARDEVKDPVGMAGLTKRRSRRGTGMSRESEGSDFVPASLRRIQSRKIEAGIRRQKTNESWEMR